MGSCFVIQPFKYPYDKRYKDIFEPAIKDAGLVPHKIDLDPSSEFIFQNILQGIINSDICLVEITDNNPNVWLELGYAIANHKKITLICANTCKRKPKLPFDIQHLKVIFYQTGSSGDYDELRRNITENIKVALLKNQIEKATSMNPSGTNTNSQSPHSIVVDLMNSIDKWFRGKSFDEETIEQNDSLEGKVNYLCLKITEQKLTEDDIDYLEMLKNSFEQIGDNINSSKLDETICKVRLKIIYS